MKVIEGFENAKPYFTRTAKPLSYTLADTLKASLQENFGLSDPEAVVKKIFDDVACKGDEAVLGYTRLLDRVELTSLEVSLKERKEAPGKLEPDVLEALNLASQRVFSYHEKEKASFPGHSGLLVRPLERVGVYAPGGRASYPSTVLMTAIPAKVAGVSEIILATPPGRDGHVPPVMLAAAELAGVDRVFSIGGAQAIAAMALGTSLVPKVDKICGPGNIFVMLAKKLAYGLVDIDGLEGPSEVIVIADDEARADYCAWELLAQSEHDPMASSILITTSKAKAYAVLEEIDKALVTLKRREIIKESLDKNSLIAIVESLGRAFELANLYAPEHLCLLIKNPKDYLERVKNAGAVFIGEMATVVFGDYVAGPSHALPTGGTARFSSPLNVSDFIKFTSVVEVNKDDLGHLAEAARVIATAEGLEAHSRAITLRSEYGA